MRTLTSRQVNRCLTVLLCGLRCRTRPPLHLLHSYQLSLLQLARRSGQSSCLCLFQPDLSCSLLRQGELHCEDGDALYVRELSRVACPYCELSRVASSLSSVSGFSFSAKQCLHIHSRCIGSAHSAYHKVSSGNLLSQLLHLKTIFQSLSTKSGANCCIVSRSIWRFQNACPCEHLAIL